LDVAMTIRQQAPQPISQHQSVAGVMGVVQRLAQMGNRGQANNSTGEGDAVERGNRRERARPVEEDGEGVGAGVQGSVFSVQWPRRQRLGVRAASGIPRDAAFSRPKRSPRPR
jgi:hypothetical protein